MEVIKVSGKTQEFKVEKIERAINLANNSVEPENRMDDATIKKVVNNVLKMLEGFTSVSVDDIHDMVERSLMKYTSHYQVAKAYITYRAEKKKNKKFNEIEEQVLSVIDGTSTLRGDNANKRIDLNSSARDYIAGITCKSIAEKTLPKKIIKAHKDGLIHWHDMDYSPVQKLHNCFAGSQKFITDTGIRKFSEFRDGESVNVIDVYGNIRSATVHTYGVQQMYEVTFSLRNGFLKKVVCTKDHTWILKNGERTTDLKVGDILLPNKCYTPDLSNLSEDDAKIWCYGFLIGDGWDHYKRAEIRLCNNKIQYKYIFDKSGIFSLKQIPNSTDYVGFTTKFHKQEFLTNKQWKYFTARQKALLFDGLYRADGRTGSNNIFTSDDRVAELIEDCAGISGRYIIKRETVTRDTNFKLNSTGISFKFLKPQTYSWYVKDIKLFDRGRPRIAYCITEPITHSFILQNGIPTGNCDLVNAEDMFINGFQMGDTRIEPNDETPFETACNLLAQINLQVSSCQYGGQTVSWSHLVPFIDKSRKQIRKKLIEDMYSTPNGKLCKKLHIKPYNEKWLKEKTEEKLREEIYKGVKTYQYQVLCHSSSNGQTPFVSNNLCLREAMTQQELDDYAILIEEILKRRIKGVKDSSGHYISPLFPKLLYWTCDGLNVNPEDPYFYLTRLAAECELKRTQPDIVSERETRRVKKGQIIPSMGCRSLLGPTWELKTYPVNTKFYYVSAFDKIIDYPKCDLSKEYFEGLTLENMSNTDFENCAYPYGHFVEAKSFENLPNGKYPIGLYRINFRGNTGWLIEKNDEEVKIYEPIVYGRWNNGVITINIPHVALEAKKEVEENGGDPVDKFFDIFTERMELVHEGLKVRYDYCKNIVAKNSPILWQHGALARMDENKTLGEYMEEHPTLCTISVGYVGLYETCETLIGESNTTENGRALSKRILEYMNTLCNTWKATDKINYAIYGTPEESLTYKFAMANRKDFGLIDKVTDKDYVVNSYHVDPREEIDAFKKIKIEGEYLALSSGGAVSYVEILDHTYNVEAIISIIQWMHKNIVYAEFNKKIAVCHVCGHEGGIELIKTENGDFKFICPNCGNSDDNKMDVTARLCGYLGKVNAGNTNKGRLDDIYNRVIHTDCKSEFEEK